MTLLVRDEADIVATNIEYHLSRGVDFVVATDNLSADGTRGILERYRERGVLYLIDEPSDDYSQGKWVTRMARMAWSDFGADWVINNDADEFWWPESGAGLKDVLSTLPAGTDAVSARRYNFVPRSRTAGTAFVEAMTAREAISVNALGEPLPEKVCHRAFADIEVEQGNHGVRKAGTPISAPPAQLSILHFPLRSYAQFANKIRLGGAAYERNGELPKEIGNAWRMLYGKLKRGELEDYYASREMGDEAIAQGLADGRLVLDERLRDYVGGHNIRAARPG